jgi:hypothetical protein
MKNPHRQLVRRALLLLAGIALLTLDNSWAQVSKAQSGGVVVDIGSRRELFVDHLLVGEMKGTRLKMHEPRPVDAKGPVRPHGHYATVLKDGDKFRLYYRGDKVPGMHWRNGWGEYHANEITKYAESKDGFNWIQPDLKRYEIEGHSEGNVVVADEFLVTHNFSPFIDDRPGVAKNVRYKALGGGRYPDANWGGWKQPDERAKLIEQHGPGGLYAFGSGDGIHWRKLQEKPVLPEAWGRYDSQNVAFWSDAEDSYICYYRWMKGGLRSIRRTMSKDFLNWTKPVDMEANLPGEHLYTSGTHPYFRAPHIYIALPTRFQSKRASMTDIVFMSARPGAERYDRIFKEAFIRPGLGQRGWGNRSNYLTWHVVPTSKTEMSMYMFGGGHYVMRYDGFVSVNAGYETGEFITKPLRFAGSKLEVNYSTSAAGAIRVEIQDEKGKPIPGFAVEDSRPIYGDDISRDVKWGKSVDVSGLSGRAVRMRFVMNEADLYSMRFHD